MHHYSVITLLWWMDGQRMRIALVQFSERSISKRLNQISQKTVQYSWAMCRCKDLCDAVTRGQNCWKYPHFPSAQYFPFLSCWLQNVCHVSLRRETAVLIALSSFQYVHFCLSQLVLNCLEIIVRCCCNVYWCLWRLCLLVLHWQVELELRR